MSSNYDAWAVNPASFYREKTLEERLRFLLRFAVLAPSSHNSQPWSFEVGQDSMLIKPETGRMLPVSDSNFRQLYLSIGCALENILVATDYFFGGVPDIIFTKYSGLPDTGVRMNFGNLASLVRRTSYFATETHLNNHLISQIPKRRTDRNKYMQDDPEPSFLKYSESRLSGRFGVRIDFVSGKVKNDIADVVLRAMAEAMASSEFRKELSAYVRSNYTSSTIGMPGFGLGIPGPISILIPFIIRHLDISKFSKKQDENLLKKHTPIFGIISTDGDDPENWIKSGQAYERIALEAERHGYKTAVMAAAIQIGDYYKDLRRILGIRERPQVFFRLGRSEHRVLPSPRISVTDAEVHQ